jgi:hypothetical protein
VQGPDERHHHHPTRLTRLLAASLALLVYAAPAHAAPPRFAALPSPSAPLSSEPPLSGGALSTTERVRHRVQSHTTVGVSVDRAGTPFLVTATQRLDVRVLGDYFFTIGAPVAAVEAAPGSASTPGLRANAIIWAGFNPGRRLLAARARLDPRAVAPHLPLRIERRGSSTLLVNTTGATVGAYSADAQRGPLETYARRVVAALHRRATPLGGGVYLTSRPRPIRLHVVAPLAVRGTVGRRRVDAVVSGTLVVPSAGEVRLTVAPVLPTAAGFRFGGTARQLLDRLTRLLLTSARTRQYETFLGNPDPTGASSTVYVYRTVNRVDVFTQPPPSHPGRDWTKTIAIAAALVAAFGVGVVVWSRS